MRRSAGRAGRRRRAWKNGVLQPKHGTGASTRTALFLSARSAGDLRAKPAAYPDAPERRLPLRVRVLLFAPLICILAVVASIGALFIYYTFLFPDPLSLRPKTTGPLLRIIGYDGSPVAERGVSRAFVPLDMLPAHVPAAVVATEDRRFYDHPGLDAWGICARRCRQSAGPAGSRRAARR